MAAMAAEGQHVPSNPTPAAVSSASAKKAKKPRPPIDFEAMKHWPQLQLEAEAGAAYHAMQARPENMLRMVTWNVWFDQLWAHQRQRALLRELLKVAPDVVCLQEVLPAFAEVVRNCHDILALYDVTPQGVHPYGVMLLVRREFGATFSDTGLPSQMARRLLSAELTLRWPGMFITTVHLESLNSRDLRRRQLIQAAIWMQDRPHSILCGDFNFDDTKTWGDWRQEQLASTVAQLENHVLQEILPAYLDCWRELRPQDPGYTFDGIANPANCRDPQERMRYDRIMARYQGFVPKATALLGTDAMEEAQDWGLRPSDHFGLMVDFEVVKLEKATTQAVSQEL